MIMAMWLHISAKNKTNVLQEGLHADSQDGAGFTKPGWQSEPHSPNTNVMCKRWDTLDFAIEKNSKGDGFNLGLQPQVSVNLR